MGALLRSIVAGALALSVISPAFADPGRGHNGHRNDHHGRYDDRGRHDYGRHDQRYRHDDRGRVYSYNRNTYVYTRPPAVRYYPPPVRAAPPRYYSGRWHQGMYVPRYWQYPVVHNYGYYKLPPPRRGHYYADVDGDILLIAAATGLIIWALSESSHDDNYRYRY